MIHFFEWKKPIPASDLSLVRENLERHGGMAVQYQNFFSFILISVRTTRLVWVPQYQSRRLAGLKFAITSLLLGVWSLPGFIFAPGIILNDLLGGAEVTGLLGKNLHSEKPQSRDEAMKELQKIKNRERYVLILMVIILFFLAIPLTVIYLQEHPHQF